MAMTTIADVYREYCALCGSEAPVRTQEDLRIEYYWRDYGRYEDAAEQFLADVFADGWAWKQNHIEVLDDPECGAEEWWNAARESGNCPDCAKGLLQASAGHGILVTERQWEEELLPWAESLPGWDSDADCDRYPLMTRRHEVDQCAE